MSDPIPSNIFVAIKAWLELKQPCQIQLNVSPEGRVVDADRVVKEHVKAE